MIRRLLLIGRLLGAASVGLPVAPIAVVLVAPAVVEAQAVHDTQTTATYASGTSFTWNHTIAAGGKILIWVGYKFAALESVSSVTVGGSGATFVAGVQNAGGGNRVELWKHESPSSGSQAIVVTFSGNLGSDGGQAIGVAASTTGISGYSAGTTAGPTSSTTPSVTIGSLGANDMPYAAALSNSDLTQQDTLVLEGTSTGNFLNAERQSTGGDGVLNWTQGTPDEWLVVGARAIASGGGGGGGGRPKDCTLLGVCE